MKGKRIGTFKGKKTNLLPGSYKLVVETDVSNPEALYFRVRDPNGQAVIWLTPSETRRLLQSLRSVADNAVVS